MKMLLKKYVSILREYDPLSIPVAWSYGTSLTDAAALTVHQCAVCRWIPDTDMKEERWGRENQELVGKLEPQLVVLDGKANVIPIYVDHFHSATFKEYWGPPCLHFFIFLSCASHGEERMKESLRHIYIIVIVKNVNFLPIPFHCFLQFCTANRYHPVQPLLPQHPLYATSVSPSVAKVECLVVPSNWCEQVSTARSRFSFLCKNYFITNLLLGYRPRILPVVCTGLYRGRAWGVKDLAIIIKTHSSFPQPDDEPLKIRLDLLCIARRPSSRHFRHEEGGNYYFLCFANSGGEET